MNSNTILAAKQHHWLVDIGLFSLEALKLQRAHWEKLKSVPTNEFMKDAGTEATAQTRGWTEKQGT